MKKKKLPKEILDLFKSFNKTHEDGGNCPTITS